MFTGRILRYQILNWVRTFLPFTTKKESKNNSEKNSLNHSLYGVVREPQPSQPQAKEIIRRFTNRVTTIYDPCTTMTMQDDFHEKVTEDINNKIRICVRLAEFAYREPSAITSPEKFAVDFNKKKSNLNVKMKKLYQTLMGKTKTLTDREVGYIYDTHHFLKQNSVICLTNDYEHVPPFSVQDPVTNAGITLSKAIRKADDIGLQMHIWEDKNSNEIIFSFRGTDALRDIKSVFELGKDQFEAIERELQDYVFAQLQKDPSRKFTFTGHSLGGGLAQIAAYFVQLKHMKADITSISISGFGGASSVRTLSCNKAIDKAVLEKLSSYAIMSDQDPVTYCSDQIAENMFFILPSDHPAPDSYNLLRYHDIDYIRIAVDNVTKINSAKDP